MPLENPTLQWTNNQVGTWLREIADGVENAIGSLTTTQVAQGGHLCAQLDELCERTTINYSNCFWYNSGNLSDCVTGLREIATWFETWEGTLSLNTRNRLLTMRTHAAWFVS